MERSVSIIQFEVQANLRENFFVSSLQSKYW